jgi:calpain
MATNPLLLTMFDEPGDWDYISDEDKARVGAADEDNGIWWMPYTDFVANYSDATICSIGPDFDDDGVATGDSWLLSQAHGAWVAGETAGGCRNDVDYYATNPQYLLELKEADDFDPSVDDADQEGKCTTVIGLMQENRRAGRADGLKNLYITLNVYKVSGPIEGKLDGNFFRRHRQVVNTGKYINQREVTLTADLLPGHYVLVPSSYNKDKDGTFLIRIFTEKTIDVTELS